MLSYLVEAILEFGDAAVRFDGVHGLHLAGDDIRDRFASRGGDSSFSDGGEDFPVLRGKILWCKSCNSRLTQPSLATGTIRSTHSRMAKLSLLKAFSTSFCIRFSAWPWRRSVQAIVLLFKLPGGRPEGLPLDPFLNSPLRVRF